MTSNDTVSYGLAWSGNALRSIMETAVYKRMSAKKIDAVMRRAEEIARDFNQDIVEQICAKVATMEILDGVTIHTGYTKCERCGNRIPVAETTIISADGYDQLACWSCEDALERHEERLARRK